MCVGKLTIIASDNGLSPGRRQAIIWTNAGILLIGPLGTNFNGILIRFHTFSFKKMHLKVSSAKWRPFCLDPNVLMRFIMIWLIWADTPHNGLSCGIARVMMEICSSWVTSTDYWCMASKWKTTQNVSLSSNNPFMYRLIWLQYLSNPEVK